MTFSPWLELAFKSVSEDLDSLPEWKKEALRRDEEYIAAQREYQHDPEPSEE